jgi:hypothetical protein
MFTQKLKKKCHPNISKIANILFYKNELKNGIKNEDRESIIKNIPTVLTIDVQNGKVLN